DRDIFVDERPMDAYARTDQFPAAALADRCRREARIPREWDGQDTPIAELDDQGIAGHLDVRCRCRLSRYARSTHAKPSRWRSRARAPAPLPWTVPSVRTRGCTPPAPASPRTSPPADHARHARAPAPRGRSRRRTVGRDRSG